MKKYPWSFSSLKSLGRRLRSAILPVWRYAPRSRRGRLALLVVAVAVVIGAVGILQRFQNPRLELPAPEQPPALLSGPDSEVTEEPEPEVSMLDTEQPTGPQETTEVDAEPVVEAFAPEAPGLPKVEESFIYSMVAPVEGDVLLPFGWIFSPAFRDWRYHTGVDIDSYLGEPVRAALAGTVTDVTTEGQVLKVVITHAANLLTVYRNCQGVNVKPGDSVKKGEVIAYVGEPSADHIDTPHLHFEIFFNDNRADPLVYLP
ncbi:MAG: M23 family metallopeptidase [Bacillota bacterium]